MGVGRLDQLITFQRCTEAPDGAGGVTRLWANLAVNSKVWASVRSKAGREGLVEGRVTATYAVFFTIYNRSDLSEKDRIIWQGEAYNMRNIMRAGDRQAMLTIEAERGVAE